MRQPRIQAVSIAHDYLTQRGGAEKVVLALLRGFPAAPVFTTLYDSEGTYPEFASASIHTSWLNRIGFFRRHHRTALPLLALASSTMSVPGEVTITSSSGWAHGFRANGVKVVYCYSPARWLYQSDAYLGDVSKLVSIGLKVLRTPLIWWDIRAARSADAYIAISTVVQQRIRDCYGIEATVVPAPHYVDTTLSEVPVSLPASHLQRDNGDKPNFFLAVSRLLPYKNVDAIIRAFNDLKKPLVVVGRGPELGKLKALAAPNVVFLQDLSDGEMRWLYSRCRANVSASFEDFGLTPIEAGAYGKPSVVLRWGGFLDTLAEGVSGVYFDEPTPNDIAVAVRSLESRAWDTSAIRKHYAQFSEEVFISRIQAIIETAVKNRSSRPPVGGVG